LPFLWGFKALAQKNLNYLTLNEKKKVYHQDIQLLRGIDGPVLSEDILFAYFAKKDFRYDPFSTTQLIINKKIPEEKGRGTQGDENDPAEEKRAKKGFYPDEEAVVPPFSLVYDQR